VNLPATLLILLLSSLTSTLAAAPLSHETSDGPYTVYYSLFPTSFLQPEIAAAYGITRARDRALINIAVRETLADGSSRERAATVTGSRNDLVHRADLRFVEKREQGAIYYLAEVQFSGSPVLYFDLEVLPDPNRAPIRITFSQKMVAQ
jgi:hypothetical protein